MQNPLPGEPGYRRWKTADLVITVVCFAVCVTCFFLFLLDSLK